MEEAEAKKAMRKLMYERRGDWMAAELHGGGVKMELSRQFPVLASVIASELARTSF